MASASIQPVRGSEIFRSSSAVWLDSIDYRTRELSIHLAGPDGAVAAIFVGVLGYRVVDERDLGFDLGTPSAGLWLFEVGANGWLSRETGQGGFISHLTFTEVIEYLVVTESECVSVLVDHRELPVVSEVRSNTSLERTRER